MGDVVGVWVMWVIIVGEVSLLLVPVKLKKQKTDGNFWWVMVVCG